MKYRGIWFDDRREFAPPDQFTVPPRGLLGYRSSPAARLPIRRFEETSTTPVSRQTNKVHEENIWADHQQSWPSGNFLSPPIGDWNVAGGQSFSTVGGEVHTALPTGPRHGMV
jgi:hypothetical protein